ncbi:MAG: beta-L-arabinofuranosidase domain-containing protein [Armatimonadota bacterium]
MIRFGMIALLLPIFSAPPAADVIPWTHPEYQFRRAIHIDASQLVSDVFNFPLIIRLKPNEIDLKTIAKDGGHLLAVDPIYGKTIPHRVDYLNDTYGAQISVIIPHIQARNINGMFLLYWGGKSLDQQPLLPDSQTLELQFGKDADGKAVITSDEIKSKTTGNVAITDEADGRAMTVDGSGMIEFELPSNFSLSGCRQFTIEAVAYDTNMEPSMMVGHGLVSAWTDSGKPEPLINFGKVGHIVHSDSRRGPDGVWVGGTNYGLAKPNQWAHYAAVYDLSAGKTTTYLNGEKVGEGLAPNQDLPIKSLRIGGWAPNAFSWKGKILKIQITRSAQSTDWIAASARNMLSDGHLVVVGPIEEKGKTPPEAVYPPPALISPSEGERLDSLYPRFRWSLTPGSTGYMIEVSRNKNMTAPIYKERTGDMPSFIFESPMPEDVPLYWRVSGENRRWSEVRSFTVSAPEQTAHRADNAPLKPPALKRPQTFTQGLPDEFHAEGVVGDRISAALNRWAIRVPGDNPDLTGMFKNQWHTEDFLPFWGESFGKFYQGASLLYRMTGDKRLRTILDSEISRAISYQEPSGYMGALLPERRLFGPGPQGSNWDLYNGHHALMALLEYHEATGDVKSLRAAMKMADLWCRVFGPGKRSIIKDIPGPDQCNLGIIAPVTWLYRLTGRQRYLDLAKFVVDEIEADYGQQWVLFGLQNKHCTEMKANHALEQLFVFEGIMDLYFITGDEKLKKSMVHWWRDMTDRERMAHGNLAVEELWVNKPYSLSWAETCVTTAYNRFSLQVMYALGESRIADMIEEATLNAYFGAQRPDGALWAYPVPVNGTKPYGMYTLKPEDPDLGCCFTYALTGMGLMSRWGTMAANGEQPAVVINYFGKGSSAAEINGMKVKIEQETSYPQEGVVTIKVMPDRKADFDIKLRIPYWSKQTRVQVNNDAWVTPSPGEYLTLKREWRKGDIIRLELDFAPRIVKGAQEAEGRAAIYRGPLLLTVDHRFNPDYEAKRPVLDISNLTLKPHQGAATGPSTWVLLDANTIGGGSVTLCDFASAGALGEWYEGWITVK